MAGWINCPPIYNILQSVSLHFCALLELCGFTSFIWHTEYIPLSSSISSLLIFAGYHHQWKVRWAKIGGNPKMYFPHCQTHFKVFRRRDLQFSFVLSVITTAAHWRCMIGLCPPHPSLLSHDDFDAEDAYRGNNDNIPNIKLWWFVCILYSNLKLHSNFNCNRWNIGF